MQMTTASPASLRRLTVLWGLLGVLIASLSGCGGGSGSGTPITPPPGTDVPVIIRSPTGIDNLTNSTGRDTCRANATTGTRAKWTVLVFMNAANNLQPDSLTNIAQMAQIGSNSDVNIVVQWKQAACADCGSPSFTETRRYRLLPHNASDVAKIQAGDTTVLNGDQLAPPAAPYYNTTTKQVDMGDYRALNDFLKWGTATYPADNLAVVMWDHGAGWRPTRASGYAKSPTFRAFSEDNDTGNDINTVQIPLALSGLSQPVDALIFDCSLMQMIEVAYEARNSARVMVGSEESPPGAGYPYNLWLTDLKLGSAGTDPCALGKDIVANFVSYYRNNFRYTNITQSVIDLSKMQNVANNLDAFATQLRLYEVSEATAIATARTNVQSYDYPENKDLVHYCELIRANATATSTPLTTAAYNLEVALRGSVSGAIIANGYGASGQDHSYGQAIYIQSPANYDPRYGDISLSKAGAAPNWAKFLPEQRQ